MTCCLRHFAFSCNYKEMLHTAWAFWEPDGEEFPDCISVSGCEQRLSAYKAADAAAAPAELRSRFISGGCFCTCALRYFRNLEAEFSSCSSSCWQVIIFITVIFLAHVRGWTTGFLSCPRASVIGTLVDPHRAEMVTGAGEVDLSACAITYLGQSYRKTEVREGQTQTHQIYIKNYIYI